MIDIWVKKRFKLVLAVTMIALLLAACSSTKDQSADGDQQSSSTPPSSQNTESTNTDSSQPSATPAVDRELVDPLGNKVTIPAEPKRILATYLEDYLVALGVKPVAQWSVKGGPMSYLQAELEGIPTIPHDLPFETVAAADPDLILIGDESLLTGDKYPNYAKIAPTYVIGNEINADWRKALLKVGEVLGKEKEAQTLLETYNADLSSAKEKLTAAYPDKPSVAAIWLVSKTFWIVTDSQSSGDVMYQDLELKKPALVESISKGEGGIWRSLSLEALAELDADHIFLINSDKDSGSEALSDPIWKSVKAVKAGNVHEYGRETSWLYTGLIANKQIVEDVLESMIP